MLDTDPPQETPVTCSGSLLFRGPTRRPLTVPLLTLTHPAPHGPQHCTGSASGEKTPRQHPAPHRSLRPPHSLPRAGKKRETSRATKRPATPRCRPASGPPPTPPGPASPRGQAGPRLQVRGCAQPRDSSRLARPAPGQRREAPAGLGAVQSPHRGPLGGLGGDTHASNLLFIVARCRRHPRPPQRLPPC